MDKKDKKMFLMLMFWYLVPSIYLLIRMNIFSFNNVDINIMGQLEWFDLINEVILTMLTIPLYSVFKKYGYSKYSSTLLFVASFTFYFIFTLIISLFISNISEYMNAELAVEYLKLQSFSMLIQYVTNYIIILYVLENKEKVIRFLTLGKIITLIFMDVVFISIFKENGAAYSEIVSSSIVGIISIIFAIRNDLLFFPSKKERFESKPSLPVDVFLAYIKTGLVAGIQIFIDNVMYAIMICKMVNAVNESGNYWVANNFIWGWLLIPCICFSEIIRKNNYERLSFNNTWKYSIFILGSWLVTIPFWSWFIQNGMKVDSQMVLNIVFPLIPFYVFYILSSFIDSWFISKSKVHYNTINSFLCNFVYYGIAYLLFKKGVFQLDMMFIVLLFGFGNVFHFIVSFLFYKYEIIKMKSKIN